MSNWPSDKHIIGPLPRSQRDTPGLPPPSAVIRHPRRRNACRCPAALQHHRRQIRRQAGPHRSTQPAYLPPPPAACRRPPPPVSKDRHLRHREQRCPPLRQPARRLPPPPFQRIDSPRPPVTCVAKAAFAGGCCHARRSAQSFTRGRRSGIHHSAARQAFRPDRPPFRAATPRRLRPSRLAERSALRGRRNK